MGTGVCWSCLRRGEETVTGVIGDRLDRLGLQGGRMNAVSVEALVDCLREVHKVAQRGLGHASFRLLLRDFRSLEPYSQHFHSKTENITSSHLYVDQPVFPTLFQLVPESYSEHHIRRKGASVSPHHCTQGIWWFRLNTQ